MKWLQSSKISLVLTGVFSFAVVAPAAQDTWTKKTDMHTARGYLSTVAVNGKVFAIGGALGATTGISAVEEYDPATDKWTVKASLPEVICALSTSAIDGRIYAIGGAASPYGAVSSRVYSYDPATDKWTRKADMSAPRALLSTSVVDGKIYAIGGTPNGSSLPLKVVEVYDPATDTWTRKADMPTPRMGLSTTMVDGKIYAVGGTVGAPWSGLSTVESYDSTTDTWTKKAGMPTGRWCLGAGEVGGKIYAIGGAGDPVPTFSTVEQYNPATDTWTTKAPMPTARRALSASVVDGKIYAIGGITANAIATVEEYDTGLTVPTPDFNGDEIVDFKDFSILVQYWFQEEPSVDIGPPPFGDHIVDFHDLAVLGEYWLKEVLPDSLIAYWKLDETEGNIAHDSVGDKDGTLNGNPVWQSAAGKVNGALEFDSVDDYVSTPFVLDPAAGAFSVFAWVKGGGAEQAIISQASGVNWLAAGTSQGKLMTELKASGRFGTPLFSEAVIIDGQWHRVGLTWDGSTRTLFVDNVEVIKGTQASLVGSQGGLQIGAGKGLEPGSFWSGLIDDVRIYDRAITP